MRKLYLFVPAIFMLCVITATSYGAQYWVKSYGGSSNDVAASVQQTNDGGFIVGGFTESFNSQSRNLWIIKLDESGNVLWQKAYSQNNMITPGILAIKETLDNGFIAIANVVENYITSYSLILKLNNAGNIIWQKLHPNSESYDVEQSTDGGYVVAGVNDSNALLFKVDADGNLLWQKEYENGVAWDGQQTSDGGYIVAATKFNGGEDIDIWVLKLDSYGDIVWEKTYDRGNVEYAYHIEQTSDGGYFVGGEIYSSFSGGWILKLNSTGNIVWQKEHDHGELCAISRAVDGRYIIARLDNNCGFYVQKLDADGEILWSTAYSDVILPSHFDCINQTSDGGYIVAGYENNDIVLMKLDNAGEIPQCNMIGTCDGTLANTFESARTIYSYAQSPVTVLANAGFASRNTEAVENVFCEADPITSSTSTVIQTTTTPTTVPSSTTTSRLTTTTTARTETYAISGYVTGDIVANVSVKLTGTMSKTLRTDTDGYYIFSNLNGDGYYTITPEHEDCEFEPQNYVIQNLDSNLRNLDFESTEIKRTLCPSETIYEEDSYKAEILRSLRNNVLSKSQEGQELIKLYYQWSPIIVKAMEADEEFREDVKEMVDGVLEMMELSLQ